MVRCLCLHAASPTPLPRPHASGVPIEDENLEEEESEQEDYEVEDILASRVINGETEYLVKWKGWSQDDNTWCDHPEPSSYCSPEPNQHLTL